MDELRKIFAKEKEEIMKDYFTFLSFESIATDPSYKSEVLSCAEWLTTYLKKIGLSVEVWQTNGPPVLFATHTEKEAKETLLIYCHYDVQPVDPIELWQAPPFKPTVRNNAVYARGAVDDKGQCFYTVRAIKTLLEKKKKLGYNLKFIIEGQEESGSTELFSLLKTKAKELKADHILIVDSGLQKANVPAITLGVRGLVAFEVTFKGSNFDLHSGTHGGIAYNPNRALVELLGSLHDKEGRVSIPGFYDDVLTMSSGEKKEIDFNFDQTHLEKHFGITPAGGEKGFSPLECAWIRPTLEFNGLSGGYAGPGFKTVIPSLATAKISCRLVPGQSPDKIGELVKNYLLAHTPKGIECTVTVLPGKGKCYRSSPKSKIAKTMEEAYTAVFQKPCSKILLGGSIPIAADLAEVAGGEMVFVGVCLAEDQIHAPNEHFGLDRFEQGYLTIYRGLELLKE